MTSPPAALDPETVRRAAAEVALFALWSWSVPDPAVDAAPRFLLPRVLGPPTAGVPVPLAQAAAELARLPVPCRLTGRVEPELAGGASAEGAPEGGGAVLTVESAASPPTPSLVETGVTVPRAHRLRLGELVPDQDPAALVLVFGGRTRLRVPTAALTLAQASYALNTGPPRASSDFADSAWATSLLPAADRASCTHAIMVGRRVVYDPPWARGVA